MKGLPLRSYMTQLRAKKLSKNKQPEFIINKKSSRSPFEKDKEDIFLN